MTSEEFKVWRILEETATKDEHGTIRVVTKKQLVGEIRKPKEEIYVTWMELVERFGEGYYVVEIPKEIHRRYTVPDRQFVRTPAYFEPSAFVRRCGQQLLYGAKAHDTA